MARAPPRVAVAPPVTPVPITAREDTAGARGSYKARPYVITNPAVRNAAASTTVRGRSAAQASPRVARSFQAGTVGTGHGTERKDIFVAPAVPAQNTERALDSHEGTVPETVVPRPGIGQKAPGGPSVAAARIPLAAQTAPRP